VFALMLFQVIIKVIANIVAVMELITTGITERSTAILQC
jgi:hypothetical protein